MQKLLFFCKTYNTVHGVHGGSEMWKNSSTYEEKTRAYTGVRTLIASGRATGGAGDAFAPLDFRNCHVKMQ